MSIAHSAQTENDYLEGAPAVATEVISEANTAERMQQKVRLYLEGGAREVWLAYPRTRTVAVHRGRTAVEVEGTFSSEFLPGVSIHLAEVFGPRG